MGDGKTVAADGSQIETWENNLLAESHIRHGGYGGLAYRHISNTYVALFSRFIPCGVWEAVYIIEGLLKNASEIQPDTIHADTQGQSLLVFGLTALMGFDLLPRIRNWHDLIFYRPTPGTRYQHIDSLFGDEAIDWTLIGRAVRTITLLRYLSDPDLREQITQVTNRNESFHNFADWLMFGGPLIGHNDPGYQEKIIKFNELLANCVIYSTAQDITDAADGHPVDLDDLATVSPYITQGHPPVRQLDPQPHPAGCRSHHPPRPRVPGPLRPIAERRLSDEVPGRCRCHKHLCTAGDGASSATELDSLSALEGSVLREQHGDLRLVRGVVQLGQQLVRAEFVVVSPPPSCLGVPDPVPAGNALGHVPPSTHQRASCRSLRCLWVSR